VIEAPELSEPSSEPRESYAGLLSVRSEALRGEPRPFVTSAGEVQDLKRIRGIGVLIEKRLNAAGITAYEQVANWTRADIDRISEMLDFKGRIERENWIEQARILASGGQTEFSRRVDRGDA
jgi:predicted flap endonuclease-1-like 5' DNA nuclease